MKVYLSGGIEYAGTAGIEWREEIEEWLIKRFNLQVFNPSKESINFFREEFPGFKRKNLKEENEDRIREIIGRLVIYECNEIIKNCDYIICLWDESCRKGAGTQGELTIAKIYGIPVYIVTSEEFGNIPSWIVGCSTKIFNDFNGMKQYLEEIHKNN